MTTSYWRLISEPPLEKMIRHSHVWSHISIANTTRFRWQKTKPTSIGEVSNFLGTVHHEYVFTIEEALDALPDVLA